MAVQPRSKRGFAPPPPSTKRKAASAVEEISFDDNARAEYLTGFHKRKQARIKHAQEMAAQKARQERIELRKQLREERKQAVEEHVKAVNKMLAEAQKAGTEDADGTAASEEEEEWGGIQDEEPPKPVDREEEYVDEGRFTTVTVESVTIDKEGIHKPPPEVENEDEEEEGNHSEGKTTAEGPEGEDSARPRKVGPKRKKKKFRYETKLERQISERKRKAKSRR
ncbi:hypothetical protein VTK73DRAFT_8477 [Phialemonium thermophilum]|uniref:Ribosomal RNA-processing protein 17 n=1 Tax=Phialemonium thermophilum TaxID=223376 RepID=A0ABR3W8B5_9PEZI